MHPSHGLINVALAVVGIDGPGWLTDPNIALLSVALVDVWKGVGIAIVIFIAGILSIPRGVLRGGPPRGRRLGAGSGTSSCR